MIHTLAGEAMPQTLTTRDVAVQLAVLTATNHLKPAPDLQAWLERGLVVYQAEKRGADRYRPWWQVIEDVPGVLTLLQVRPDEFTDSERLREALDRAWSELQASPTWIERLEAILTVTPARADCEDLTGWWVVSSVLWGYVREAAPAVYEVMRAGELVGWHALPIAPLPDSLRIVGEVPGSDWSNTYALDVPSVREGETLRQIDPSAVGGMPRPGGIWRRTQNRGGWWIP